MSDFLERYAVRASSDGTGMDLVVYDDFAVACAQVDHDELQCVRLRSGGLRRSIVAVRPDTEELLVSVVRPHGDCCL